MTQPAPPPAASASEVPATEVEALRAVVEGTARATGEDFFRTLVQHLAQAVGAQHAFISEFLPPSRIRTRAFWSEGRLVDNIEYELDDTPCLEVIHGGLVHYESGVQARYPLTEQGIEGYLGVPLVGGDGQVFGHLCVFDERPMAGDAHRLYTFQVFAARASAELDRLHNEEVLRDSEHKLRDLFEEAPIAYVLEDPEARFISANRAAMRILGIREDEVHGMVGLSLVPDTPEAQRRVSTALEAIRSGKGASGVILELRRKNDGQQIFIQWWTRPDPSGQFTRTMFVDVTDRILLEQEQARLKAQNLYLQEEIKSVHNFDEIVGASPGLTRVLDKVRRVAPTDATALILGETGTGKELIARAIHSASHRADKPFIKINIAALPPSLIESELFGHEKGAFSGALQRRTGRFELANGGTIFLDEIGEVPMEVQVKLLRVLQEREFERIGGNQTIRTDVRVIAATNRDLQKSIREGSFRSDLYYRLNVFPVDMPPLRERLEDIPLLVSFFVQKHGPRVGRRIESIPADTMQRLLDYDWPGNIRELENVVERAMILSSTSQLEIDPDVLEPRVSPPPPAETPKPLTALVQPVEITDEADLNTVQRVAILGALRKAAWVIEGEHGAARQLGMKPATLRHRMKKLGIARATAS